MSATEIPTALESSVVREEGRDPPRARETDCHAPGALPSAPALSILIVNWNGRQLLRNLIRSLEQHAQPLASQVIVVDNGSTDGSVEMLRGEFPDVVVVPNDRNLGFAAANNQAAALAAAPLLLLLNNDTLLKPGSVQAMLEYAQAHPQVSALGPRLVGSNGKTQPSARNLPSFSALLHSIKMLRWTRIFRGADLRYRSGPPSESAPQPAEHLAAAALLIRRDAFEKIGGFDETFRFGVEDMDLCARLRSQGQIVYLPDAVIEHFGRVSTRANRAWTFSSYQCGYAHYISKHHGRLAALLYKVLFTLDLPIRIGNYLLQMTIDRVRNRPEKSAREREMLRVTTRFLFKSLPEFWRS